MNNYKGQIDLEALNNSEKTIYEIQNLVNNTNLSSNFEELEKYFRKINFEHSYCINYKESLEIIYADLNDIRRDVNRMAEILSIIKSSYSNIDEDEKSTLSKVESILKKSTTSINDGSEENITRIEQTTIPDESIQKKPYSTIPIGLAIGATGIAGSVGAVVVNEKYGPEIAESEVEEYHDLNDDNPDFEVNETFEKKDDEISPYHASRTEREVDRHYGNLPDDIQLENYDDEDDENKEFDFDDFDE